MSYILDALRKAEMERELSRVPGISSRQKFSRSSGPRHARRWLFIAATLVSCSAIAWGWRVYGIAPSARAAAAEANDSSEVSVDMVAQGGGKPVEDIRPEPQRQPNDVYAVDTVTEHATKTRERKIAKPLSAVMPEGNRAVKQQAARTVSQQIREPEGESVSMAVPLQPTPVNPVRAAATSDVMAMIAAEAERSWSKRDISKPQQSAQSVPALPDSGTDTEVSIETEPPEQELPPLLRTLPYRFQSTLPKIVINAQAYAEDAEARFVIINMKKYREGERTQEGVMVERIDKGFLVLNYQGQPFRMQR